MCGLVGIAGDLAFKDKDILKELLVVASLRGTDSAGVAGVNKFNDFDTKVVKIPGTPYDLFDHVEFSKAAALTQVAWMGHTRKATIGGISKATAHPMYEDHIIMTHNGTLDNWRTVFERDNSPVKVEGNFSSDSQALCRSIATHGIVDTIEHTQGAYALVWFDQNEGCLNFLRNRERDLWYCFSKDSKKIFWASEWRMLALILDRNGVETQEIPASENRPAHKFANLPPDVHVKWKVNGNEIEMISQEELKGDVKKPVGYSVPFWNQIGRYAEGGYNQDKAYPFNNTETEREKLRREVLKEAEERKKTLRASTPLLEGSVTMNSNTTQSPKSSKQPSKPQEFSHSSRQGSKRNASGTSKDGALPHVFDNEVTGYNNRVLHKGKEFDDASKYGCQFCQQDVSFEEAAAGGIYGWVSPDAFICTKCCSESIMETLGVIV